MAETKQTKLVLKKKKWYRIIAPTIFREAEIGQTYLAESEPAIGRKLKVSLTQITGDPKAQNIKVEFKITGQHEGKLLTEVIGYELTVAAMKRMVRRNRTKIQDSFVMQTADNKKIRIKPVAVTKNKILSGTRKEMRKRMINYIKETVAKTNFETMMKDLLSKKFQKMGNDMLRKLCPVYNFDISSMKLIEDKTLG